MDKHDAGAEDAGIERSGIPKIRTTNGKFIKKYLAGKKDG